MNKEQVIEYLESLPLKEIVELVKELEDRWNVSAAAPVMAVAGAAASVEQEEEKTEFDVILKGFGDNKLNVVKAVRTLTAKALKESKDLVEASASEAQIIKQGVSKEEAQETEKALKDAGGVVEVK